MCAAEPLITGSEAVNYHVINIANKPLTLSRFCVSVIFIEQPIMRSGTCQASQGNNETNDARGVVTFATSSCQEVISLADNPMKQKNHTGGDANKMFCFREPPTPITIARRDRSRFCLFVFAAIRLYLNS